MLIFSLLTFLRIAREQSPAEPRRDGVVYLHEDYRGYAAIGVDDAEGCAGGIERLGDQDAADDSAVNFDGCIVDQEAGAGGVAPAPEEKQAEQKDVAPIDQEGGAVVDELGEERGREWSEGDDAEESDMDPGEIAVGTGEEVELGLLADPENAIGHDAHEVDKQTRRKRDENAAEVVLRVDRGGGGDAKVEDQEGHGYGEDAVAEGGEAFDALTGNAVVERMHPTEFSTGGVL